MSIPYLGSTVTIKPCKRDGDKHAITGKVVRIEDDDCIANSEWFLAVECEQNESHGYCVYTFRMPVNLDNAWTPRAKSLLKIKGTWKIVAAHPEPTP